MRLYLNGAVVGAFASTRAIPVSAHDFKIGNGVGTGFDLTRTWSGSLAWSAVYNATLTPEKILAHWNRGITSWPYVPGAVQ